MPSGEPRLVSRRSRRLASHTRWRRPRATTRPAVDRARCRGRGVSLRGRIAVVTGAGSGIGRATTALYVRAGAAVALVDRDALRRRHALGRFGVAAEAAQAALYLGERCGVLRDGHDPGRRRRVARRMSDLGGPAPALAELECRVREDLARSAHPSHPWLRPRPAPGGGSAHDVVIVGGGQSGLATTFGLTARTRAGEEVIHAREVVLATGQEGMGGWVLPPPLDRLSAHLRARAADVVDFAALRGKTVAVVGAGASAFDNAATALEAGAAEVVLLCRRLEPQVVQPYRWLTFRSFLRHLGDLPDEWRWRFMGAVLRMREGFPQATYDRCARHPDFRFHSGAVVLDAAEQDGRAVLTTASGTFTADLVIAAAGVDMDFEGRPELARFANDITTWSDAYAPPAAERDDRLARFPYLADDYALTERSPGLTPWIRHIHLFSIASTMSLGASGSSINAMTTAVPKLVHGLTRRPFVDDTERLWADFLTYDVPQAVLREPRGRDAGAMPDACLPGGADTVSPLPPLRSSCP